MFGIFIILSHYPDPDILLDIPFFTFFKIVPPSWIVEPKDVHTNGKEGFKLECKADGSPKPTIKWITSKGKFGLILNSFMHDPTNLYLSIFDNRNYH